MDEKIFAEHLKTYLKDDEINNLMMALNQKQIYQGLIFDSDKITEKELLEIYPNLIKHPFIKDMFLYDKNILPLGKSLLFNLGAFYLFEPCSGLVSHFLNPKENDLVLDIAAAPGGKSIHTSFLMHNNGLIVSNEISSSRANILSSNSEKYGRKNLIVTSTDIDTLLKCFPNTFSKIILDAPCSGSGMFRKENKMGQDWTIEKVLSLSKIQKDLIVKAYQLLKEGGEMVYSTCSYSYQEDEEVILHLLENTDAELIPIPHVDGEYRSSLSQTIHLFPHRYQGEGHFIAKIRKKGINDDIYPFVKVKNKTNYLGNYSYQYQKNDNVFLVNNLLDFKNIHVLRYGIKVGTVDKKLGLVYDHNLGRINLDILPSISLSKEETLLYLQGLTLKKNLQDGYYLVKYHSLPFGITKVSKNNLKNHYPKGLRIKIDN